MFIFQKYATFWQGMAKHPRNPLAFTASAMALLLLVLVFFSQKHLPPIAQQEVELPVASGTLKGTLWLPQQQNRLRTAAVPGVILVHGMASSRRSMQHLAKTLAYQGIGAFVFDLQGYGESSIATETQDLYALYRENAMESLQFLQSHPAIQSHHIAFVGHSLGAEVVAQLPENTPGLRIAIGMHPESNTPHPSLQWWTGLYDPLHPPYVHPGTNAYVSPCTGHSGAPEDLCIAQQLRSTLGTFFSLPSVSAQSLPHLALKAQILHWSTVALGACLLLILSILPLAPGGYPLLLSTLIALSPFVLAGYFRWLYSPYCASAIALLTLGYFLRQIPTEAFKKGLQGLTTIGVVHLGVSTLRGIYALFTAPELSLYALLQWPLFGLQSVLLLLQAPHDKFLDWGFTQTYARTEPGLLLIGLFMMELLWPGAIVRRLRHIAKGSRQVRRRLPILQVLPLLGLMGVFLGIAYWRYQQGFLHLKIVQTIWPLLWGVILPELLILGWLMAWLKRPRDDSNIRPTV